jgi:cellulase/cellobiase CelA1
VAGPAGLGNFGSSRPRNPTSLSGWSVGWTFPGTQKITDLWNASFSQSGQNVAAGNLSYNGTLAAGASTTFGFTGSYTGNDASPASLSCC